MSGGETSEQKELDVGSLQQFVPHQCSADDMGPSKFSRDDVHRIGILDLRIFNLDRHGGNILVDNSHRLVPIDHGLSLPPIDSLGEAEFGWLYWRQAKQPFSDAMKQSVAELSIEQDAALLRQIGLPERCVTTARVSTAVLKRCVAAGWSLYEIGSMFTRKLLGQEPSVLESLVRDARTEDSGDIVPHVIKALDMLIVERGQ